MYVRVRNGDTRATCLLIHSYSLLLTHTLHSLLPSSPLQVLDIVFLHGCRKPTICVLYQDTSEARHVKTYEVILKDQDFDEGPWAQPNVESGANMLIAVPEPAGGVLVLGQHTIVYHSGRDGAIQATPVQMQGTSMRAYGQVDADGSR